MEPWFNGWQNFDDAYSEVYANALESNSSSEDEDDSDNDFELSDDDSYVSIGDKTLQDDDFSDEELEFLAAACVSCGNLDVKTPNEILGEETIKKQKKVIKRLQLKIHRLEKANENLKQKIKKSENKTDGLSNQDLLVMKDIKQGVKDGKIWCSLMNDQVG